VTLPKAEAAITSPIPSVIAVYWLWREHLTQILPKGASFGGVEAAQERIATFSSGLKHYQIDQPHRIQ
jgi:hypothetical protein